jgi:hypothetical protein
MAACGTDRRCGGRARGVDASPHARRPETESAVRSADLDGPARRAPLSDTVL